MGRWAQRYRDAATLEERRLTGLALLRSGRSRADVAPVAFAPALVAVSPSVARPPQQSRDYDPADRLATKVSSTITGFLSRSKLAD